jgi:hypothetical protein
MKNLLKFLGIIALVAVIGFTMAGCSSDSGGGSDDEETPERTVVVFQSVTANGADATTTEITLTFNAAISGLTAADITLSGIQGVTKGILGGTAPNYVLPISGQANGGVLSVAVAKADYDVSGSPKTVEIWLNGSKTPPPATGLHNWEGGGDGWVAGAAATYNTDGLRRRVCPGDGTASHLRHEEIEYIEYAKGSSNVDYLPITTGPNAGTYYAIRNDAFRSASDLTAATQNNNAVDENVLFIAAYYRPAGSTNFNDYRLVTELANDAFHSAAMSLANAFDDIREIVFLSGSQLKVIGEHAFDGFPDLTTIFIPRSVTSIGKHAFANNPELTVISIPIGVTEISDDTFAEDEALEWVYFARNSQVLTIGERAFEHCEALKDLVDFPKYTIKTIKEGAFAGCTAYRDFEIHAQVDTIGHRVFEDWAGPTQIIHVLSRTQAQADAKWGVTLTVPQPTPAPAIPAVTAGWRFGVVDTAGTTIIFEPNR